MPPLEATLIWFFRAETVTRGLVSLRRSRWRPNFNSSAYGSRVIGKTNKNYRNILHSVTDYSGFFAFFPVFNLSNLLRVWALLPKLILSIPHFTNQNFSRLFTSEMGHPLCLAVRRNCQGRVQFWGVETNTEQFSCKQNLNFVPLTRLFFYTRKLTLIWHLFSAKASRIDFYKNKCAKLKINMLCFIMSRLDF